MLCSLALHHFTEEDAVRLLRALPRTYSADMFWSSDLRRGLFATVGVYLLTAMIFRDPMTRYDGRVSAARAFSFREFACARATRRLEKFRPSPISFCAAGDLVGSAGSLRMRIFRQRKKRNAACSRAGESAAFLFRRWARCTRPCRIDPNCARGSRRGGRSGGEYFREPAAV